MEGNPMPDTHDTPDEAQAVIMPSGDAPGAPDLPAPAEPRKRTATQIATEAEQMAEGALHQLATHQEALDALRAELRADPTPAEDHLADLVGDTVNRHLGAMARQVEQVVRTVEALTEDRKQLQVFPHVFESGKPRGALRKVAELMKRVTSLEKGRETSGAGPRFKFRGVDETMNAIGAAMREVGLIGSTEVTRFEVATDVGRNARGGEQVYNTVTLTSRYTFTDPDDGSTHSFEMIGQGRDASDKAANKAASMALKYGLLQALMIPTEDTPDSDLDHVQVTRERPDDDVATNPGPPERTPQERADRAARAARALAALRTPGITVDKVNAIGRQVALEDLTTHVVEGATLQAHALAVLETLRKPPPPPAAPPEGSSDEPPWPWGNTDEYGTPVRNVWEAQG